LAWPSRPSLWPSDILRRPPGAPARHGPERVGQFIGGATARTAACDGRLRVGGAWSWAHVAGQCLSLCRRNDLHRGSGRCTLSQALHLQKRPATNLAIFYHGLSCPPCCWSGSFVSGCKPISTAIAASDLSPPCLVRASAVRLVANGCGKDLRDRREAFDLDLNVAGGPQPGRCSKPSFEGAGRPGEP